MSNNQQQQQQEILQEVWRLWREDSILQCRKRWSWNMWFEWPPISYCFAHCQAQDTGTLWYRWSMFCKAQDCNIKAFEHMRWSVWGKHKWLNHSIHKLILLYGLLSISFLGYLSAMLHQPSMFSMSVRILTDTVWLARRRWWMHMWWCMPRVGGILWWRRMWTSDLRSRAQVA